MDEVTRSSFLDDPKIAVLTFPNCRSEKNRRVKQIEKTIKAGEMRVLYVRIPGDRVGAVDHFRRTFPTCKVQMLQHKAAYVLVKMTPKERKNEREELDVHFTPDWDGPDGGDSPSPAA